MTTENQAPEGGELIDLDAIAEEACLMTGNCLVVTLADAKAAVEAALAAPAPQAPGMAIVPVETLAAWKSMVNSLAVQSLRSERTTTGVILKSLIQDEIDAAQQTKEPTNDR